MLISFEHREKHYSEIFTHLEDAPYLILYCTVKRKFNFYLHI